MMVLIVMTFYLADPLKKMLMTMFVMTMTLVTTVIVRLIKLAGSFKNILSTMITRDRTKDFVILHPILQSVGKSVGQTEYLVRKSAQLYLL